MNGSNDVFAPGRLFKAGLMFVIQPSVEHLKGAFLGRLRPYSYIVNDVDATKSSS